MAHILWGHKMLPSEFDEILVNKYFARTVYVSSEQVLMWK